MSYNFEPLPPPYRRKRQIKNKNNKSSKKTLKNSKKNLKKHKPKSDRGTVSPKRKALTQGKNLNKKPTDTSKAKQNLNKFGKSTPQKHRKKEQKLLKLSPKTLKTQKNILYIFIVSVLLLITGVVLFLLILRIDTINIVGETQYTKAEVKKNLNEYKGRNILFLEPQDLADHLERDLPYVEVTSVKKDFPETLNISITQAKVSTMIKTGKNYTYLNNKNRILGSGKSMVKGASLLSGLKIDQEKSDLYAVFTDGNLEKVFNELYSYLTECEFKRITAIDLTDQLNLTMVYDNRIKILLGTSEDLKYKLKMTKGVLDSGSITDVTKGTIDASMAASKNRTYFRRQYK